MMELLFAAFTNKETKEKIFDEILLPELSAAYRSAWGWLARFRRIEECCYTMNELDDMPSWEELTLEQAIKIAEDVAELHDECNGDWDSSYDKRQYQKAKKFIADFRNTVDK